MSALAPASIAASVASIRYWLSAPFRGIVLASALYSIGLVVGWA